MSFVERNKRWLLPLLGAAAAGVLWMNLSGQAPAAPPAPPGPPGDAPPPPPPAPLETAPAAANDAAPLLLAGRRPLGPEQRRDPTPAALHPERWKNLAEPPGPPTEAGTAPPPAPEPPPPLDFIIQTPRGREAWMRGRGYREGAILEGGWRLQRINLASIVVTGPGGEVERFLQAGPRRPDPKERR